MSIRFYTLGEVINFFKCRDVEQKYTIYSEGIYSK